MLQCFNICIKKSRRKNAGRLQQPEPLLLFYRLLSVIMLVFPLIVGYYEYGYTGMTDNIFRITAQ